jgi:hypothetical protein
MEYIILGLLLLTFIPVFIPFKKTQSDKRGQDILTITYIIYLVLFLLFVYFVIFKNLSFCFELGDLMIYALLYLAMIVANLGFGLRNSIGREFKYFFSLINVIASIYMIQMLMISNVMK